MKPSRDERRSFLWSMGGAAGAAWLTAQWPSMAAAARHAHQMTEAVQPGKLEVLTAAQATEIIAIAARIIPTDDEPGATEAGVVYFIDRALQSFAAEDRPVYESGIKEITLLTAQKFPGVARFSAATAEQQDAILTELSKDQKSGARFGRPSGNSKLALFPVIWEHTILGFLVDPEAGGNRDFVGWKVIGRDPAHSFSPPFGEYDKNYPGWQPNSAAETDKK